MFRVQKQPAICVAELDLSNVSEMEIARLEKPQVIEILIELGLDENGKVDVLKERLYAYYKNKAKLLKGEPQAYAHLGNLDVAAQPKQQQQQQGKANPKAASEESGDEATQPKYQKWRVTDPAEIPPRYYHARLFKANFPLVEVFNGKLPVRNKFERRVLDPQVTRAARKKWMRRAFEVASRYAHPLSESQAFAHQFALVEGIQLFTKPSREEIEKQNEERCVKRKWLYEGEPAESICKKRCVNEVEELAGFAILPNPEESQGPLGSLMEEEEVATGFADGVISVHDDRAFGNVSLLPEMVETKHTVAIVERKFAEDGHKLNARYQGGFYAVKHALANLQNGHGSPVYVIIFTASTWSYGILVPEGCVQIRDGKVDAASMTRFAEHQAITGVAESELQGIQARLAKGTEFYRRNYRENPSANYCDGPQLVGKFFLCSKWFHQPIPVNGGSEMVDGQVLFDGLMRVVVGDTVCNWSSEKFNQRWQVRQDMIEEAEEGW